MGQSPAWLVSRTPHCKAQLRVLGRRVVSGSFHGGKTSFPLGRLKTGRGKVGEARRRPPLFVLDPEPVGAPETSHICSRSQSEVVRKARAASRPSCCQMASLLLESIPTLRTASLG